MEKYKICPGCGKHNDPRLMECDDCGTDLTGVPIVDDSIISKNDKNNTGDDNLSNDDTNNISTGLKEHYVRICSSCGHKNPSQARICESCGEDISDVIPVPEKNEENKTEENGHYFICDMDGQQSFPIPEGEIVIGREHELKDYLLDKPFVSRTHARLVNNDSGLYVENLSRTNFTYINNKKISDGLQKLECGDVLSLGGIEKNGIRQSQAAYFMVVKK